MKKILLASAVLIGMGASQAFAATSDSWTGLLELEVGQKCELSDDVKVSMGATTKTLGATNTTNQDETGTATFITTEVDGASSLDANTNGLADESFSIDILFDGQSFCNYAHTFMVARQTDGFAFDGDISLTSGSDEFLTAIPYSLHVDDNTWNAAITEGTKGELAQPLYTAVTAFSGLAAPANASAWKTNEANLEELALPRFHNNGLAGGNNTTAGLNISLDYTPIAAEQVLPLLQGTYSERLFVYIGAAI